MKCCACKKEIMGHGKLISCDGDFVCDDACLSDYANEMSRVLSLKSDQLESWLYGRIE